MRAFFTPRHILGIHPSAQRRGTAVAEFAVVAPVFGLIMLGMFELSRGWFVKDILNDAARKGCRTAVLPRNPADTAFTSNTDVTSDVNDILTDNGIATTSATITIMVNGNVVNVNTAKRGDIITVKVALPVSAVYWGGTFFLAATVIESETVIMMREL